MVGSKVLEQQRSMVSFALQYEPWLEPLFRYVHGVLNPFGVQLYWKVGSPK